MLRLRKTHEKIEGWVRQQLVSIRAGEEGARRRRARGRRRRRRRRRKRRWNNFGRRCKHWPAFL
ncbi:unnamed protein product [Prorocentrum cordatum]|uniref:Uncharacterized protein n=1 Tax=Prorocentrum cordatum TaxID=2364126 RepID=A0ABN9WIM0_9DINO|nr:unnamed protein product [Polarella glacialis]